MPSLLIESTDSMIKMNGDIGIAQGSHITCTPDIRRGEAMH